MRLKFSFVFFTIFICIHYNFLCIHLTKRILSHLFKLVLPGGPRYLEAITTWRLQEPPAKRVRPLYFPEAPAIWRVVFGASSPKWILG